MCLQTRERLRLSLLATRYSAMHSCSSAGRLKKYVVGWPGSLALLLSGVLFGVLFGVEAAILTSLLLWRGAMMAERL